MRKIIGFYRKCDLLTMLSIVSAFIGIIFAIKNHYTISMFFLACSGICDAFDGRLARKHKYSNEQKVYGSELDSLADVISFGVFPAVITAFISTNYISFIICILYVLCGVVRLAYFNMLSITKTGKSNTFIGLPITSIAIGYPLVFVITRMINFDLLKIAMPATLVVFGLLFILRFEFPKPDVGKIFSKIFNKYTLNYFLFPVFIVVAADIFYKLAVRPLSILAIFTTISDHFIAFIAVVLFFSLLLLLINSIINNIRVSKIIVFLIVLILIIVNDIKYTIMGNPIEFSDINYLNPDNMKMMGTAGSTIGSWIIKVIIKGIVWGALGFFLIFIDKTKRIEFKKIGIRVLVAIVSLFLILCPFIFIKKTYSFSIKNIYRVVSNAELQSYTNDNLYYEYGYFQGMYLNEIAKKDMMPEGYSKIEAQKALDEVSDYSPSEKWQKSNVVIILSEAFSDIQRIEEIQFDKSLMPNIDKYAKDSDKMVFDLHVPAFGGASTNTEYEVLTGGSLSFAKSGYIPWTQYYNDVNGKYAPNIIKEFNDNNYTTMYLTPWGKDSYRSEYVYGLFGVDEKIYKDHFKCKAERIYCSDMSLMDNIYEQLEETSKDNYKLIVSASSENHYPYETQYKKYDINVKKTSYNKEDTNMLKTYAQGIYNADAALNYLYKKIQKLKTPTVIVFYGDHLPYTVDSKGDNPYLGSTYFHTPSVYLNNFRAYTTKGVILANYKLSTDNLNYINASYLGAYVLNKMDLQISDYFKLVDYSRTIIPVFNRQAIYKDGKTINISDLEGIEKEQLEKYRFVQYNKFYDFN